MAPCRHAEAPWVFEVTRGGCGVRTLVKGDAGVAGLVYDHAPGALAASHTLLGADGVGGGTVGGAGGPALSKDLTLYRTWCCIVMNGDTNSNKIRFIELTASNESAYHQSIWTTRTVELRHGIRLQ